MSGKEKLSLDEFATAPRKQRPGTALSAANVEIRHPASASIISEPATEEAREKGETSTEAGKALRQMKRARMKGTNHFVNVNLDRETKRRLKLASFNMDTSMQAIMEKAIRQYLDANGY
jgi:hypothetical protein